MKKSTIIVWNNKRILVKVMDRSKDGEAERYMAYKMQAEELGIKASADDPRWQVLDGEARVELLP